MTELVAAAGMWKLRCDSLKRDVMEQIKGLGDRMDWLAHYPEGQTPLDNMRIPQYTPAPRVRGLLIGDSDVPVGKRSTIDLSLIHI